MIKEKGIAYCGLVCAVCKGNTECEGCRSEGCKGKDWCENLKCCKEKELNGCWECDMFPCRGTMLDKLRIRAFARFVKDNGEPKLLVCMENNEKAGIIYHHPGMLTGDYDRYETEQEIMDLILYGRQKRGK